MRNAALFAVACSLAIACAPSGPPNPPPRTPPPPPERDNTVLVPVPNDDPRVVRCGVDDRPRNVVGARDTVSPRLSAVDRSFFGDRIAVPGPTAGAPMAKPTIARQPPPEPLPNQRPPLIVTVDAPRPVPGGAMPSGLGSLRPDLSSCEDVLESGDVGTYAVEVAMASSGAPTEVRVGERAPSKFVRCAMERACQIRAAAGEATRIVLPIVVRTERAVEVPPPPPPVSSVPLRVTTTIGEGGLRDAAERAASQCVPRDRAARVRVEIEIVRTRFGNGTRRAPELLAPVSRLLEGTDRDLVACTMRTLLARGAPSSRSPREVVEITWNP